MGIEEGKAIFHKMFRAEDEELSKLADYCIANEPRRSFGQETGPSLIKEVLQKLPREQRGKFRNILVNKVQAVQEKAAAERKQFVSEQVQARREARENDAKKSAFTGREMPAKHEVRDLGGNFRGLQ